jgi:C1A family cysteine protease
MIQKRNRVVTTAVGLAVAVLLAFSSAFVYASPAELDQIRQAIKAKGAKWHADQTSVSELTWKEKKLRLGAGENEDFLVQFFSSPETAPIPLVTASPPTVDWRNLEGLSYVSPVKNQGSCGSCWAFATTAGLESQVMIGTAGMPIDLSEQILVSCSGAGSCAGGSSASASNFIRDTGLPVESCFGYTATNNVCSNACPNWQESTYSIRGWHSAGTSAITPDDIKNALYAYGPMIATMYVYNDFFSYRSGVYSYTTGSYAGAHAVLVVGYDDTQQAFIVKNSWGSGWGEAGFFMIAYSEVGGTSRFAYSTMVYDGYGDNPPPDPQPVPCTYSLSPTGSSFRSAGGAGNFILYAQGTCGPTTQTPVSSAAWVTITSVVAGSSSTSISYAVEGNTGSARSATIDVAGLSFKITQQQASRNKGNKQSKN